METIENLPPVKWSLTHPRLAAWIVLSAGMVILLVIEARNVGLSVGNWIALIVATVLVAGACIWIISWEDVDEPEAVDTVSSDTKAAASPNEDLTEEATSDADDTENAGDTDDTENP